MFVRSSGGNADPPEVGDYAEGDDPDQGSFGAVLPVFRSDFDLVWILLRLVHDPTSSSTL